MKKVLRSLVIGMSAAILLPVWIQAQELTNTAGRMMEAEKKLTIGGYGQIDYNQLLDNGSYNNGVLDVHRLVLMFGYKFNSKTQFITEIECERGLCRTGLPSI